MVASAPVWSLTTCNNTILHYYHRATTLVLEASRDGHVGEGGLKLMPEGGEGREGRRVGVS